MKSTRFALGNLDNLLHQELHPTHINATFLQTSAQQWLRNFNKECENIIQTLKGQRYRLATADLDRRLQLTYADLLGLLARTRTYAQAAELPEPEVRDFYRSICDQMESIIDYIKSISNNYAVPTDPVPAAYQQEVLADLHAKSLVLQAKMKSKNIDPKLRDMVPDYLREFSERKSCCHQQLAYARNLVEGLLKMLRSNVVADWDRKLLNRLLILNFNRPVFFGYCTSKIAAMADLEEDNNRKSALFAWYAKEIRQLLLKPGLVCDPDYEPIDQLLLSFLAAQQQYLKDLNYEGVPPNDGTTIRPAFQGTTGALNVGKLPSGNLIERAKESPEKLHLNTSMRVVAVAVQLMIDEKLITPGKGGVIKLANYLAEHISTNGSESLSGSSLYKRLSEKSPAACASMIHILEEMIIRIKSDYLA